MDDASQNPQAAAADPTGGQLSDSDMQAIIQQLGGVSADPEKLAALKQQMALSQSLRASTSQNAMPQGQQLRGDHGGVYVGASPLQTAASAIGQIGGNMQDKKAQQQMTQMAGNEQQARSGYMQLLAQQLRQQQGGGALSTAAAGIDPSSLGGGDND